MLKTKLTHVYGSQEKHNLEVVKLTLEEPVDEKEALENGWLLNEGKWYTCRSVRLSTNNYSFSKSLDGFSVEHTSEVISELKKIYKEYLYIRGFSDQNDFFEDNRRQSFLILKDEEVPVAFTKFMHYQGGLESQLTCWNYHKPKLSLGKRIIDYEIEYAKSLGYEYLYIGEGVEASSIYKANLSGFQWWTGSEWSTDKELYKSLCIRDSSVKTLYDLSMILEETDAFK